jgi:hypothetical protein
VTGWAVFLCGSFGGFAAASYLALLSPRFQRRWDGAALLVMAGCWTVCIIAAGDWAGRATSAAGVVVALLGYRNWRVVLKPKLRRPG